MTGEIILGLAVGLPLLLGIVFRTSTSHIFFSLMAGELLGRYFGHDIDNLVYSATGRSGLEGYGEILLMVIPMLLTAYILRGTIHKGKLILHIIPLAATGAICAAFILPILPEYPLNAVQNTPAGDWLLHLNKTIIGALIIMQLLTFLIVNHVRHHRNKKLHDKHA